MPLLLFCSPIFSRHCSLQHRALLRGTLSLCVPSRRTIALSELIAEPDKLHYIPALSLSFFFFVTLLLDTAGL
jgi:hypothetical protein